MRPANERRRYNVTSSLIGWARTRNKPWPQYARPSVCGRNYVRSVSSTILTGSISFYTYYQPTSECVSRVTCKSLWKFQNLNFCHFLLEDVGPTIWPWPMIPPIMSIPLMSLTLDCVYFSPTGGGGGGILDWSSYDPVIAASRMWPSEPADEEL